MKKYLLYAFALSVVFIASCSSDDGDKKDKEEPSQILSVDDLKMSLENANVYLSSEGTYGPAPYRKYLITNGEYVSGYGYSFDDYEGATFFILMEFANMQAETFSPGNFPVYYDWVSELDPEPNYAYVYFSSLTSDGEISYSNQDSIGNHEPVVISGGVDPGDVITFKFSGKLSNNEEEDGEGSNGSFHYSGTVIDARAGS
jgi:hypothetical protein